MHTWKSDNTLSQMLIGFYPAADSRAEWPSTEAIATDMIYKPNFKYLLIFGTPCVCRYRRTCSLHLGQTLQQGTVGKLPQLQLVLFTSYQRSFDL